MPAELKYFPSPTLPTEIVKWARLFSVADIGQITTMQRRELERAVAVGFLVKGKGGPYPVPVDVYAHPGFDFAEERKAELKCQSYLTAMTRRAA